MSHGQMLTMALEQYRGAADRHEPPLVLCGAYLALVGVVQSMSPIARENAERPAGAIVERLAKRLSGGAA